MAQVNIRIDDDLKEKAEVFLNELGFTFSTAFNVFIKQAIRERRIPFDIDLRSLYPSGDYQLSRAELILRADEMEKGTNIKIHELIEVPDND
ncbi:MAG: type II toxin-antitoxin system RelB/DinJ family antitoxin [Defluviitaleaceae bacterium]|nr:type II toxin-antitoxin system RelB/DinJ family antitoxin [Defluviitaleaceae bacterium]